MVGCRNKLNRTDTETNRHLAHLETSPLRKQNHKRQREVQRCIYWFNIKGSSFNGKKIKELIN